METPQYSVTEEELNNFLKHMNEELLTKGIFVIEGLATFKVVGLDNKGIEYIMHEKNEI